MLGHESHGVVGPSAVTRAATTHRSNRYASQVALPPNGFAFRPSLLAGQIPTAVATGDFNGDGKLDWAVSNGQDNSVWLYLGNGDGTASLPTILPTTGIAPAWMIATDLNGDGKLDLVVAEADSSTIGVFLGNGDGTFQTEARYSVPAAPLFLLAGDFTGDGKVDIAAGMIGATTTGPIAVLPGDGQGHLGTAVFTGDPNASVGYWLAAADLNGDGKLDLIVVDPDDGPPHGGAQAYLNNGNGTFTAGQVLFVNDFLPPPTPSDLALSVAIADVNNDGCQDVVMTDSYGLAYVFDGNCNGTFVTPGTTYALGDIGGAIQLVDVNGDGVLDLVTSGVLLSGAGGPGLGSVAGNEVSVLFGDGSGHFGAGRTYRGDLSMYSMAVADLNGDGFPDLVTANQGSNTATVYMNDGSGGFGDPQGEAFGYNSGLTNAPDSPFVFADVDGNGTLDMVLLESAQHYGETPLEIATLLNDGTGKFSPPILTPAWPSGGTQIPGSLTLADFRNTGHPDILILGNTFATPFIFFAPNIGGGQFGQYTMTTPAGAQGPMAAGDFNGDGKLDFVTASIPASPTPSEVLTVFLGNGDGTFQTGQSITFETGSNQAEPTLVYVGDFNRDGNLDVLVLGGAQGGTLYEFLGNGDGTFQAGKPLFATFGAFVLADVNNDGWPDIIAATDAYGNPYGGGGDYLAIGVFSVFLGQPDGTFQNSETYSPYLYTFYEPTLDGPYVTLNPFPGIVGDFNGDGNLDVAVFPDPVAQSSEMQILYGNGDSTLTPSYVSYPLGKFWLPQFAADVNGDGRADLIELDNYTTSFNVVKSVSPGPALQLELLTTPVTGNTGYGRVILNTPSSSTTTVSLTASSPGVSVPNVVIPAGSVSQDFQFSIGNGFNPQAVFSIQAQVGSATVTANDYVASPAVPVIEFQPTGLLFTGVQLGATSAPQTLTLKNLGAGPLTISAIEVGLWFSETDNCGSSLAQGANCTIQVTFTSPFLSAATGTLTVYDNVSDVRLSAALEGFSVSTLQISPCCLSFSQLLGGTSPSQNVTLTNVSTMPIQVDSVVATAGFSATNQCSTIAVAGQCNIMVTFTPTASGTTVGSLSISTNVPNTTAFVVPLSGNATDFSLGSAASVTVAAGRTATYNLSATSIDDFSGSISLSCGGGPMGTTCKVTPSSLALSSGGSNFYSVIVTTTANSMGLKVGTSLPGGQGALLAGLLCLPLLGIVIRRRRGRNVRRIMAIVFLSCLGVVLVSCGSGGGGGGGGNSGTPPGTYNLTVTGQVGSVSNTTVVTLIVQ